MLWYFFTFYGDLNWFANSSLLHFLLNVFHFRILHTFLFLLFFVSLVFIFFQGVSIIIFRFNELSANVLILNILIIFMQICSILWFPTNNKIFTSSWLQHADLPNTRLSYHFRLSYFIPTLFATNLILLTLPLL